MHSNEPSTAAESKRTAKSPFSEPTMVKLDMGEPGNLAWLTILLSVLVIIGSAVMWILAPDASAHRLAPYIAVERAEELVFDSRWADKNNIEDVWCNGIGRKRDGGWRHFVCDAESTRILYGDPFICDHRMLAHTTEPDKITIFARTEADCLPALP